MNELESFNSERIYWAVEQVEREPGDIDELYLDDNLFYLKSEADKVIAELKRQIEFLKITHGSCGDCNKCADGMGKVFEEALDELKAQKAQAEDDCAYWKMSEGNAVNAMHETEEACMCLTKSERHQKRKRCLAMAMWCRCRACFYDTMRDNDLYWARKSDRAYKWHKRWLKIAEKFKETK